MKALLAMFSYEANTFNPEVNTVEAAFRQNGVWRVGAAEVRDWAVRGQGELTGSIAYLEERNWTRSPSLPRAAVLRAGGSTPTATARFATRSTARSKRHCLPTRSFSTCTGRRAPWR